MRKFALLLILLIVSQISLAATVQYANISVTVLNRPPEIMSITILPEEAYYDSVLECVAEVSDEVPEKVSLEYRWHKNGELLGEEGKKLKDVKDNDEIRCEATPIDMHGEKGEMKSAEIKIFPMPVGIKVIKPVLNFVGVETSARELQQSISMNAVTGMVTGGGAGNSGITVLFLLGIFAIILIGINIAGLVIAMKRKTGEKKL